MAEGVHGPARRPDGTVVLDFNRAINYPSAFTPYGTCPMPVKNNSLDSRIEAGEKDPTAARRQLHRQPGRLRRSRTPR